MLYSGTGLQQKPLRTRAMARSACALRPSPHPSGRRACGSISDSDESDEDWTRRTSRCECSCSCLARLYIIENMFLSDLKFYYMEYIFSM